MKALEDDTDYKLRTVKESELNLMEIDEPSLRQNLKDRQHGNDYINDVEEELNTERAKNVQMESVIKMKESQIVKYSKGLEKAKGNLMCRSELIAYDLRDTERNG